MRVKLLYNHFIFLTITNLSYFYLNWMSYFLIRIITLIHLTDQMRVVKIPLPSTEREINIRIGIA